MKKYYATECDPETYDYRCYYDEDMAVYDNIWAGGNSRNFRETNEDLRKDVVRALEDSCRSLYFLHAALKSSLFHSSSVRLASLRHSSCLSASVYSE